MKKILFMVSLLLIFTGCSEKKLSPKLTNTLKPFHTPESVLTTPGGVYYVSNIGGFGVDGDGAISKVVSNSVSVLAEGMNDPKGLEYRNGNVYVADKNVIWEIDDMGNKKIYIDSTDFPIVPTFLNDLVFDKEGNLYVSDTGVFDNTDGAIYKISTGKKVSTFVDYKTSPEIHSPNGLIFDNDGNLLVIDYSTGNLLRVSPDGKSVSVVATGLPMGDGLAYDGEGYLYASSWQGGSIYRIDDQYNVALVDSGFKAPADITIDKTDNSLLVPEFNGNRVSVVALY